MGRASTSLPGIATSDFSSATSGWWNGCVRRRPSSASRWRTWPGRGRCRTRRWAARCSARAAPPTWTTRCAACATASTPGSGPKWRAGRRRQRTEWVPAGPATVPFIPVGVPLGADRHRRDRGRPARRGGNRRAGDYRVLKIAFYLDPVDRDALRVIPASHRGPTQMEEHAESADHRTCRRSRWTAGRGTWWSSTSGSPSGTSAWACRTRLMPVVSIRRDGVPELEQQSPLPTSSGTDNERRLRTDHATAPNGQDSGFRPTPATNSPVTPPAPPALQVFHGDNVAALGRLRAGQADLIYIDPPFNTGKTQRRRQIKAVQSPAASRLGFQGRTYKTSVVGTREYSDYFTDYVAFLEPRLDAYRVLAPHGSLYLHVDYREVHRCRFLLDDIFGADNLVNEIIWAYDFGGRPKDRWPAKHDNILFYVKDRARYTFNRDAIERIPYMAPGLAGADKAARGKLPTDTWWHHHRADEQSREDRLPDTKARWHSAAYRRRLVKPRRSRVGLLCRERHYGCRRS